MVGFGFGWKVLTRFSAYELINQSKRWHRMANRLPIPSVEHEDDAAGYQWPGLPGLPWQHEDLTIVSLTNGAELSLEGNLMNHCVGSYFDDCRRGDAHIVSIRDESGNRLSTAEISLEQVGDQIRTTVVQHQPKEIACLKGVAKSRSGQCLNVVRAKTTSASWLHCFSSVLFSEGESN